MKGYTQSSFIAATSLHHIGIARKICHCVKSPQPESSSIQNTVESLPGLIPRRLRRDVNSGFAGYLAVCGEVVHSGSVVLIAAIEKAESMYKC
jgi:hypothetical protein